MSDVDETLEGLRYALDTAKHQTRVAKATFARIALACPSRREVNRGSLDDPSVWGVVALATVAEEGVNLLRTERDALRTERDTQLALATDPEVLQSELDARIALANLTPQAPEGDQRPGGVVVAGLCWEVADYQRAVGRIHRTGEAAVAKSPEALTLVLTWEAAEALLAALGGAPPGLASFFELLGDAVREHRTVPWVTLLVGGEILDWRKGLEK